MDLHHAPALFQTPLTVAEITTLHANWGDIATLPAFHATVTALCTRRGYTLPERYAASVQQGSLTISPTFA